jgi:hypothetical protein
MGANGHCLSRAHWTMLLSIAEAVIYGLPILDEIEIYWYLAW